MYCGARSMRPLSAAFSRHSVCPVLGTELFYYLLVSDQDYFRTASVTSESGPVPPLQVFPKIPTSFVENQSQLGENTVLPSDYLFASHYVLSGNNTVSM